MPLVDRGALTASTQEDLGLAQAYGASPYLELCDSWPVGEGSPHTREPVTSNVPVLIMTGRGDEVHPPHPDQDLRHPAADGASHAAHDPETQRRLRGEPQRVLEEQTPRPF